MHARINLWPCWPPRCPRSCSAGSGTGRCSRTRGAAKPASIPNAAPGASGADLRHRVRAAAWSRRIAFAMATSARRRSCTRAAHRLHGRPVFVATSFGINYAFAQRSLKLWLIDAGYHIAAVRPVRPDPGRVALTMAATPLRWYFDFLSPFSYLHWQKVKALRDDARRRAGADRVRRGARRAGQKGPAEIPGKREFTYRHVLWQARAGRRARCAFRRRIRSTRSPRCALCIAAGSTPEAVDTIFDWIWRTAARATATKRWRRCWQRWASRPKRCTPRRRRRHCARTPSGDRRRRVRRADACRSATQLFWGNDAHEFALAALRDPAAARRSARCSACSSAARSAFAASARRVR